MKGFQGFTIATIEFLNDLRNNNNKTWFEENRPDYTEKLLTPMRHLVAELSEAILAIDPSIDTTPAVGKTISRINRDTRFSKNKSPYKSNMWVTFKRPSPDWKDSPCFFFEIFPESYRYGMGYYAPTKDTMDKFRGRITQKKRNLKGLLPSFQKKIYSQ